VALYDEALRRRPDEALLHFNRAVALEDQGRLVDALESYNTSLRLAPELADAHYNAARLHEQLGDAKKALRHLNAYRRLERPRR
jgi:tetratricopeptide (TPR) repeat protein